VKYFICSLTIGCLVLVLITGAGCGRQLPVQTPTASSAQVVSVPTPTVPQFGGHLYFVDPDGKTIRCWVNGQSQDFKSLNGSQSRIVGQTTGWLIVESAGRILAINLSTKQERVLSEVGRDVESLEVLRIQGNKVEWRSAANWRGHESCNFVYDLASGVKKKLPLRQVDRCKAPNGWVYPSQYCDSDFDVRCWVGNDLFILSQAEQDPHVIKVSVKGEEQLWPVDVPTFTFRRSVSSCRIKSLTVTPDESWAAVEFTSPVGNSIGLLGRGDIPIIQGSDPCISP
jgi:hypothetical protein